MPAFMKDEMKKKDEEKLEEMKQEIKNAFSQEQEEASDENPAPDVEPDAGTEGEGELADEAAAVQKQVESLTDQLKETEGSLKRLRADFENFRRRTAKEKEEVGAVVVQEFCRDMLPLLDNFERAMATEGKDSENFRKGVEMIFHQFQEILKKNGLEVIDTKDAKFDPNFHQAVMRVQNPEMEDEAIAAELQKGYIVKGRVIRPSMVQVVANG